jgi:ATP-dependent exoDNAse (exonuclease V) beta subunit
MNQPSVTQLLSLLDKPALLNWANKIGLEGVSLEEHRAKSKSVGRLFHEQVEAKIKTGKEIEDPELRKNYDSFFSGATILESEKVVSCEHWQGRFDVKFSRNGMTYLCDFKSNANGVYLENKLQLVAYSEIEQVDEIGIISLPDFKYFQVRIKDRKPYVGILRALNHIHKCKIQIGK